MRRKGKRGRMMEEEGWGKKEGNVCEKGGEESKRR